VFRATARQDSAEVGLKRALDNNTARQRIDREIEAMVRLTHRNVMPVFDYDSSRRWYTMPLAARTLIRDDDKPDCPSSLAPMVRDVIAALEHSHTHGFVHRDVAPGNILLINTEGLTRWVLSDWGIVRNPRGQTTSIRTQANSLLGTEQFAAPELWSNAHDADHRADFYGLGRVVAWLLGCRLVPNVPAAPTGDWSDFVTALTATNRDARPATHGEVRALIPRDSPATRAVLVGDVSQMPHQSPPTGGGEIALDELVESALDRYVVRLIDSDELITSLIAETNASGFYADEIAVLSAGPLDIAHVRIPFAASVHLSGEQEPERMFAGDGITVALHGELGHDGNAWVVVDCEVRGAEIDDYSE
jgi:serine/threonine protein kinase